MSEMLAQHAARFGTHARRFFWVPEGVLFKHKGTPQSPARIAEIEPAPELFPYVRCYWKMEWDLGEAAVPVYVVPSGCVNLVIELAPADRLSRKIVGVRRDAFQFPMTGRGCNFGVQFTPGGFEAFFDGKVAELCGQTLPLDDFFPDDAVEFEAIAHRTFELAEIGSTWDRLLKRRIPKVPPPQLEQLHGWLQHGVTPEVLSERQTQRLFERYVGISPRMWRRTQRFQEAAKLLLAGEGVDCLRLALELGYYDQPHFVNDFRSMTGVTPSELLPH